MRSWWLKIELSSDLCSATGDCAAGLIDLKTALDGGLPVIPGKRIKGALRNEGLEMRANGFTMQETLDRVFGSPGLGCSGSLYVGDAHLYKAASGILEEYKNISITDYEEFMEELKNRPELNELQLEEIFTVTRTRTAIDRESGSASDASLRTMQLVPRGTVFRSRIELREPEQDKPGHNTVEEKETEDAEKELLTWCVKALRHMGVGITRGFGEITCTLEPESPMKTGTEKKISKARPLLIENERAGTQGPPPDHNKWTELPFEIQLKSPVLFWGEAGLYEDCSDQIPGSALLGALAGMYIRDKGLGEKAHLDEGFRRIFLDNGVQFGHAFLNRKGRTFYPCPLSFALKKNVDGERERLCNRLFGNNEAVRRKSIHSQVCLDREGGAIYLADVKKEVRMHHARPIDRGIGHALNDRIKKDALGMGQFYQYTCLSRGQVFAGVLKGGEGDLRKLLTCLEKRKFRLSLGRSRTAEYGECIFRPGSLGTSAAGADISKISAAGEGDTKASDAGLSVSKISAAGARNAKVPASGLSVSRTFAAREEKSKKWLLWLVTPMVLADEESGSIGPMVPYLEKELKRRLGQNICSVIEGKTIFGYTRIAGYNSKWRLPTPQCQGLAPGSVIALEADTEFSAADLENLRFGEQLGKGYGQIIALPLDWACGEMQDLAVRDGDERPEAVHIGAVPSNVNEPGQESDYVKALLQCRRKRVREQDIMNLALQKAEKLPPINSNTISSLIGLADEARQSPGDMYARIMKEARYIKDKGKLDIVEEFMKPCSEKNIEEAWAKAYGSAVLSGTVPDSVKMASRQGRPAADSVKGASRQGRPAADSVKMTLRPEKTAPGSGEMLLSLEEKALFISKYLEISKWKVRRAEGGDGHEFGRK